MAALFAIRIPKVGSGLYVYILMMKKDLHFKINLRIIGKIIRDLYGLII